MKPLLFTFFLLVSINTQAQYCDLATGETNPDIVNNDSDPDNDILDWRTPTYRVKFINQDGSNYEEDIVSPFFTQTLTSVTNPNVIHLDVESKDFEYSDGWELIQWDFGFGQQPGDPNLGIQYPFLVLYNKYESKLRYFFYTRHQLVGDIHTLSLQFLKVNQDVDHLDASLEHVFTPIDPIENYTDKGIKVETPNVYNYNGQLWLMGEVPIAYDPCSCQFPSMYDFKNDLHTSQGFSMTLESKDGSSIEQIFKDDAPVGGSGSSFSINKLTKALTKGNKNFKNYASAINGLEKNLITTVNQDWILKWRLKQSGWNGNNIDIDTWKTWAAAPDNTTTPAGLANAAIKQVYKERFTPKDIFPDWLKGIVPYAGYIAPIVELFMGGGKVTPPTPMMFNINLDFEGSGSINDTFALQSNSLYVPGSNTASSKGKSDPIYNNVLGVITIMEKPTLLWSHKSTHFAVDGGYPIGGYTVYGDKTSYKLKEPIKLALNPASGLRIKSLKASFLLGTMHKDYSVCNLDPEGVGCKVALWNVSPGDNNAVEPIRFGGDNYNYKFEYMTPYMPLECLEEYTFRTPDYTLWAFTGTRLQISAILEPIDNPNGKDVYFSTSCKVKMEDAPYDYDNTPINPYKDVPWNATTTDVNEVLNGDIVAWNDITITGDFIWNEQTKKIFEYGPAKEIVHNSTNPNEPSWTETVYLTPNLNNGEIFHGPIIVRNLPDCGQKNNPVDKSYLEGICNSINRYNPLLAIPVLEEDNEQGNKPTGQKTKIFPNPVVNTLRILYPIQDEDNSISIVVFNTLGRPVLQGMSDINFPVGNQIFTFPVENLSKGIYMVSIKNNSKREILKMVKL